MDHHNRIKHTKEGYIPCKKTEHLYSIDILRTLAAYTVIVQHAASAYIDLVPHHHIVANMFRNLTRWNILIFVMIIGFLFLKRNIDFRIMCTKYIKRIAISFLQKGIL